MDQLGESAEISRHTYSLNGSLSDVELFSSCSHSAATRPSLPDLAALARLAADHFRLAEGIGGIQLEASVWL